MSEFSLSVVMDSVSARGLDPRGVDRVHIKRWDYGQEKAGVVQDTDSKVHLLGQETDCILQRVVHNLMALSAMREGL